MRDLFKTIHMIRTNKIFLCEIIFLSIFSSLQLLAQSDSSYYEKAFAQIKNKNYSLAIDYFNTDLSIKASAESYWGRAIAYEHISDFSKAIADYDKAIELHSSNKKIGELYLNRGLCNYYLADTVSAKADYAQSITQNFDLRGTRNKRSVDFVSEKDSLAISIGKPELSELKENFSIAFYVTAELYFSEHKLQRCIIDCNKATALNPDYVNSYYLRAIANIGTKEFLSIIPDCDKAIKLNPDSTMGYFLRASANYGLEAYDSALSDINIVLKMNNSTPVFFDLRRSIYEGQKKYDKAIDDALSTVPLHKYKSYKRSTFLEIANLYNQQKDSENAITFCNKAIALKKSGYAYSQRARAYWNKHEYNKAILDYNKAYRLYENDTSKALMLRHKANAYRRQQKYSQAKISFMKSIELVETVPALLGRGRVSDLYLNEHKLGVADFERILELDKDSTYYSSYAYCYLGNRNQALLTQAKIIEKSKKKEGQYYNMACIYAYSGESKEALNYLDLAFANGFDDFDRIHADEDFNSIKETTEFKDLILKYKNKTRK